MSGWSDMFMRDKVLPVLERIAGALESLAETKRQESSLLEMQEISEIAEEELAKMMVKPAVSAPQYKEFIDAPCVEPGCQKVMLLNPDQNPFGRRCGEHRENTVEQKAFMWYQVKSGGILGADALCRSHGAGYPLAASIPSINALHCSECYRIQKENKDDR